MSKNVSCLILLDNAEHSAGAFNIKLLTGYLIRITHGIDQLPSLRFCIPGVADELYTMILQKGLKIEREMSIIKVNGSRCQSARGYNQLLIY